MTEPDAEYPGIQSTRTLFGIIEYLWANSGATITELARELGIAKSTVHDHLASLHHEEFVVKDEDGYRLGLQFLNIGMTIKDRNELVNAARPKIEQIANETGEAVWLMVEEHGRAVYLHNAMGDRALQVEETIGTRTHLHFLAAGKAILACSPPERVDEIVRRHGLPERTENTIVDRAELVEELERIREQGFAVNDCEQIDGVRAVGVPIRVDGEVLGAVSVTAAKRRFRGERFEEEIPNVLLGAANEIEIQMAYS